MTDTITLVAQTNIVLDDIGNETCTETTREIFCEVYSITQNEFYSAANTELNPEYRFTIFFADYEGESIVEYNNVRYSIYRTYRTGDNLELYVERKMGV